MEWVKTSYDAEEAQRQNAIVLSEIRRAVTRLETVSYQIDMSISADAPALTVYKDRLDAGVQVLIDAYTGVAMRGGIEAITKHKDDWEHAIIRTHQ